MLLDYTAAPKTANKQRAARQRDNNGERQKPDMRFIRH